MSTQRHDWRRARLAMFALFASLCCCLYPARAAADVIRGSGSEEAGVAPDVGFEEECLGDTAAEDCELRASLMEGELASLLAQLEGDSDPATRKLFQGALDVDSPLLNDLALAYMKRVGEPPEGFLEKAKSFFFGTDAPLAVSAANALDQAPEQADRDLAATLAEGRKAADYAPTQPLTPDENNPLLVASIRDARFDVMQSFADEEVFSPADRLLMYDRIIRALPPPEPDYAVSAYMTDATVDEVAQFFTQLFGEPLGTLAQANADYEELTLQLAPLQTAAASGDRSAIDQLSALTSHLRQVQGVLTLGGLLQLETIHAENDQLWLDGTVQDFFKSPRRAVTVGHDEALDKTVIRYVNAGIASAGKGSGGSGSAGAAPGPDDSAGAGGANERADESGGSGCGCNVPGGSHPSAVFTVLALVALCGFRARRLSRAGAVGVFRKKVT